MEMDNTPAKDKFSYVNLIDIYKIIIKDNELFEIIIHKSFHSKKKELDRDFRRLNTIRNYVMHPLKGITPDENDFEFIREFSKKFNL